MNANGGKGILSNNAFQFCAMTYILLRVIHFLDKGMGSVESMLSFL